MSELSKLNVRVTPAGEERKKTSIQYRTPLMKEVIEWIQSLSLDPLTEEELLKKVKKYPLDAMNRFREKISYHIGESQKKIKKNKMNSTIKEEGNENEVESRSESK